MTQNKIKNKINKQKLDRYFKITGKALSIAKKAINKKQERKAVEILDMAERYYNDARWFQDKSDWVNAFAALSYAHGWLDVGSKLELFKVKDSRLFVIK